METRQRVVLLVITLSIGVLLGRTVKAQVNQSALAQQILGGNVRERSLALEQARLLGPQQTGRDLRAALIKALEREDQVQAQRYHADLRGEALEPLEDPEYIFRLSRVVVELRPRSPKPRNSLPVDPLKRPPRSRPCSSPQSQRSPPLKYSTSPTLAPGWAT